MNEPTTLPPTLVQAAYRINGVQVPREAFYAMACDPRRSIAVEACAGAGKTWMLVSRMVRALLDGCAPQDILAITFTKKAAGEMRDRLNTELRRCAGLSNAELIEALNSRGMTQEEAARRVDELRTLHARTSGLGRPVQVRTFHSWFAALLRGAPLSVLQELELPAQYELLEDDARAVALVWPRFYAALSDNPQVRKDFMECVARHGRHQTIQALKNALNKRVEFRLADTAGVVQASVQTFGELYPKWSTLDSPELSLLLPGARDRWHARARALGTETNKTPKNAAEVVIRAFEVADEPAHMPQRLAQLRKAFFVADEDRLTSHLAKYPAAQEAEAELRDLCAASRQHTAWLHHQRMMRLTRVLLAAYAGLKRDRGWVDMNDVEGAAQRLLGDPELSGWMQQRLDARLRHVLIDEFQDTNPLQWQSLYGWLSSYAGAGSGEAPCVFLVGDPKQSIYRFRRAEPQVFKAAQDFVVKGLSGALLSCDHTRRCATGVVNALNSVMQSAVLAGEYSSGYRTHTTESAQGGAVLVLPQLPRSLRERNNQATGDEPAWRDSLGTPRVLPEETMSALEAEQAAQWIAAEIAHGQIQAEHIMVLSRRRERLAWMHKALLERGIASEQPEKLDLCEAPAVQDVVALLDVLVSERHDLSLARALRSPLFGWSDADLAQLARLRLQWVKHPQSAASADADQPSPQAPPEKISWWQALHRFAALDTEARLALLQAGTPNTTQTQTQDTLLTHTAERLMRYRSWVQSLPPHDALSSMYEDGDVLARFAQAVPPTQRTAVLAQLRDLLTHSLAQEGGRFLTPYRLVRALKAGGIQATPTQTPGAVRLLTIHGAKGLEAHTVLMLDTDTGASRPDSMGVLVDWPAEEAVPRRLVFLASEKSPPACAEDMLRLEQQARALEELNALYVAMTRAEVRLVVSSFEPHQRGSATSWYQRLNSLATELDPPAPVAPVSATAAADFSLPGLPACSPPPVLPQSPPLPSQQIPEDDTATRIGLALHRLLQWHPTPAAGFDWSAQHLQAAAREFGLSQDQVQETAAMARVMVNGPAAWAWDDRELTQWGNEVELFHQGQLLRLDRLVRQRPGGTDAPTWWVLDFKTAQHPERQPALLAQMASYRNAMAAIHPGEPLRLAFINPLGALIEVTSHLPTA